MIHPDGLRRFVLSPVLQALFRAPLPPRKKFRCECLVITFGFCGLRRFQKLLQLGEVQFFAALDDLLRGQQSECDAEFRACVGLAGS